MNTLERHLKTSACDKNLQSLIIYLSKASKEIYKALKKSHYKYGSSKNSSGDTQLDMDLTADRIMEKFLIKSNVVESFVSEERKNITKIEKKSSVKFKVAFDPLDGSSVSGTNFAVGTCVGIYDAQQEFKGMTGGHMPGAFYALYGPNLKVAYSTGKGTHIFSLNAKGTFILEEENIVLEKSKKICSIGDFQDADEIHKYKALIHYWMDENFKLRYSGSLTADIHHMLKKKGGIFCYPGLKMRMLYEALPHAFLIDQAKGSASDTLHNILDKKVSEIHEETNFICGSSLEVKKTLEFLGK